MKRKWKLKPESPENKIQNKPKKKKNPNPQKIKLSNTINEGIKNMERRLVNSA